MMLADWVTAQVREANHHTTRAAVIKALERSSGVSKVTLHQTERGAPLVNYKKAVAVSEATRGVVTVLELLDKHPGLALARILPHLAPAHLVACKDGCIGPEAGCYAEVVKEP